MKKLIAMIALGVMVAGSSFAQTTTTVKKDRKPRTERAGQAKTEKILGHQKKEPPKELKCWPRNTIYLRRSRLS